MEVRLLIQLMINQVRIPSLLVINKERINRACFWSQIILPSLTSSQQLRKHIRPHYWNVLSQTNTSEFSSLLLGAFTSNQPQKARIEIRIVGCIDMADLKTTSATGHNHSYDTRSIKPAEKIYPQWVQLISIPATTSTVNRDCSSNANTKK